MMITLVIAPVQWSNLKDIDDVRPISDADTACLTEIREVLRKHSKMDRFGVALLHSHFPLDADEIMLESSDEQSRTLTIKPVKRSETGNTNVGTIWMLRDGDLETMAWCRTYCKQPTIFTGHKKGHVRQK
jgi:hypothetical protein